MKAATGPREPSGNAVTFSGLGAVVNSDLPIDTAEFTEFMSKHATRAGFVLARDLQLSEENFKALVQALGNPVQHKYKTGQADLIKLEATREKGKVVVGRGPLPLHTDGILLGKHPDLIVLYSGKFEDKSGSGETLICDKVKAWEEMPQRLREILETKTFEYRIEEQKHYYNAPPGWYPIPTFCDVSRIRSLNLALQFEIGQERSWSLRVANVSPVQSDAILAELNAFFLQPRYTYQHRWKVGDLVIIDNHRTLHGRTAISENGIRVLFRGQVILRKTVLEEDKKKSQYPGAVVLAAPRSVTTLLRKLLNAHPQIYSPTELNLVSALARTLEEVPTSRGFPIGVLTNMLIAGIDPETRFVDGLRELIFDIYDTGCQAHEKSMWVDKDVFTGFYVPEATHLLGKGIKYIWLRRHGLDVAMSQEEKFQEQGVFAHEYHQYIAADRSVLAAATQMWVDISRHIALFAAQNPDNVLSVKYEDLVQDAKKMDKIQTFLGANDHLGYICDALRSTEDFGKGDTKIYATKSVHGCSVGRWKSLDPETRRRLAPIANPMFRQMGYEEIQDVEVHVEQIFRQAFYDKIIAPMIDS